MSFEIALPTYKRASIFKKKTYDLLRRNNLLDRATLFIQCDEDERDYKEFGIKIVRAPAGYVEVHNFMYQYYEMNEAVLCLHDDVDKIVNLEGDEVTDLDDFFGWCFDVMAENECYYGGLYPTPNPYFMKNAKPVTFDLRFIYDPVNLWYNMKIIHPNKIKAKVDFERCILYWKETGKICRFNHFSLKTQYNPKSKGGFGHRDAEKEQADALALKNEYPEYIKSIRTHTNGTTSLVLHRNPCVT